MVKEIGWFLNLILPEWVAAITLAPFGIYIRHYLIDEAYTNAHERIHWKQQLEMLIIFYYLWYLIEWIIKLFIHGKEAYHNLSFEREARLTEGNLNYGEKWFIPRRKHYHWIKYL